MPRITPFSASVFSQVAAPAARRDTPLAAQRSPRPEANRGWLLSRDVPVSTFGSLRPRKVTLPAPGKVGEPTGAGGGGGGFLRSPGEVLQQQYRFLPTSLPGQTEAPAKEATSETIIIIFNIIIIIRCSEGLTGPSPCFSRLFIRTQSAAFAFCRTIAPLRLFCLLGLRK